MSFAKYEEPFQQQPRHDSYYPRDHTSHNYHNYESSHNYERSYRPRTPPQSRASVSQSQYYTRARQRTWPPAPSVEDETTALTREVSHTSRNDLKDDEPPHSTRGAVDQEKVIEDIERPDDYRFVLVSDPSSNLGQSDTPRTVRDRRRKSAAERGNIAHIKTDIQDPPVFTERVSTPYAYTKPQKETLLPTGMEFLSPEPVTPAQKHIPTPVGGRETHNSPREKKVSSARPSPAHSRRNSMSETLGISKDDDVFDDSDIEPEDTTHLRTERKPARYSFVKNDLQKEDLRTDLYGNQPKPESRPRTPPQDLHTSANKNHFHNQRPDPYGESPKSSSSSLSSTARTSKLLRTDTGTYSSSSRAPSRPVSPVQLAPSPQPPSRHGKSPVNSRPSSRGGTRPASPSLPNNLPPRSPNYASFSEADRHATYPPVPLADRTKPPARITRHDTLPTPTPRIDVQSPSPARKQTAPSALPYPVDDRPLEALMPSESQFQFDHSSLPQSRQAFAEPTHSNVSRDPGSPRLRDDRERMQHGKSKLSDESPRASKTSIESDRPRVTVESSRAGKSSSKKDMDKPLPSCPRDAPTSRYDDWYSLKGYRYFDICPSCYHEVFASTPFASELSQTRLGERPVERVCDFSNPWIRLAWLVTIQQRRPSLEMIYALADISEIDRPCPGDRELSSERIAWYGIADQRDGIHVANFAICSSDKRMIEALFPTMRGYFTKLPSTFSSNAPVKYTCSLRTSSRRFPKYLDLLLELDAEAQALGKRPDINRFIKLARDNAFKGECAKSKASVRKPWHFIPSLPEFTVCEECYEEVVWPAMQSRKFPSAIPRMFNKTIQLVPNEDPDIGSSCCLYSPRMRKVWDVSVQEEDFAYLKRKALDRKRAETRIAKERKRIVNRMMELDRGSSQWERAKSELKALDKEWAFWE